jgi:capsular exopolysaccharide synthesis family protein
VNAPIPRGFIPDRAEDPVAPVSQMTPVEAEGRSGFDLHTLMALLRRNLLLILVTISAAIAVGLILTLLSTPKYVATSRIQIEQQVERVLATEDTQAPPAQDTERFLQTQTDVLRSRSTAIGVAQSLKLFGNAAFHNAMGIGPPQGTANNPSERETVIGQLRKNMAITLPRNSRIVSLAFEAQDPNTAASVANAYAQVFITSNLQRKFSSSAYARDFLAGQLVEAKARLEGSERELNGYARAAGLIATRPSLSASGTSGTGSQSVTTANLQQLNDSYNTAKAARIEAEQRWRNASSTPLMSLPDVLGTGAIQNLLQQRAGLTAEVRLARERYRGEYPLVQEKTGQLQEVNAQIQQLAGNVRDSIRNRYEIALQQERSLAAEVSGLKEETLGEQDRSVRFTILAREVDTNRTMYDGLLQRFKELSAAAGIASNNISIVDSAEAPLGPSSPNLPFNLAVSLLLGAVLAGALVVAREQIDDAVRSPSDLERKLNLATLGVVPRLPAGANVSGELHAPKTPIAEAYNALRSNLLYSTPQGLPRSILVTSTQAGEGKSTTSVAVATGFAKLGRRVVLVDGDLRRPSLHRILGGATEHGLSDLLIGQASVADVAKPIEDEGFWLITAGPLPPNPTDLLSGGRMAEVLRGLEESFDLVVVDGPPVLGLADAPMLAATTRAVLFVIEANRGLRGRTKTALRRLRLNNATVLGALLTKFEAKKAGLDQYYGYNYYSYGEGKDAA